MLLSSPSKHMQSFPALTATRNCCWLCQGTSRSMSPPCRLLQGLAASARSIGQRCNRAKTLVALHATRQGWSTQQGASSAGHHPLHFFPVFVHSAGAACHAPATTTACSSTATCSAPIQRLLRGQATAAPHHPQRVLGMRLPAKTRNVPRCAIPAWPTARQDPHLESS